ncbi:hypothetical protein ONE63_010026 [Megalurothrips usitatus]|uniref:Large ribosomal subunit protein mL49 n=1 Tax=Megalurothrips usitatus TaxID=439358 RepID=A0AAV7XKP7_9NEOP|nr:hypothetical protein ONE63_010026 [Megalurothrips usitatus]
MATMKTLGLAFSAGAKCFRTRLGLDILNRSIPLVHCVSVRHKYKSSPLVSDDPGAYTGFEVSRNPEEWKYVQDLLPQPIIKDPAPKPEYPSGWRPQNPPADAPYFVKRTANHQLPVYMVRRGPRGQVLRTKVRYIQGDIWTLEEEIRAVLKQVYPRDVVQTQVNEVAGVIILRGDYVSAITEYLKSKGW